MFANSAGFILSAFRSDLSLHENYIRHESLLAHFHNYGVPCKTVLGTYLGVQELAVFIPGYEYFDDVEDLARRFNQESYLELDSRGQAYLTFLDDRATVCLGKFTEVSPAEADKLDAYTRDVNTGRFFACLS